MMPKQFFLLSSVFWQQKPKASQAQTETRLAVAEKRRNQEFNASMLEHGRRFSDEEEAQREGEKHRSATFNRLVAGLDETFGTAAKELDKVFQEEEARRQDTFHGSEDLREKRFSQAESSRTVGFMKLQEMHSESTEWYTKIHETCFQRGRQEREEIFQKLEKNMEEQLERLLRWEEDCFTSAEQQRDKIVREIVNTGNFPQKPQGDDVRRRSQVSANDPKHHSLVYSDASYRDPPARIVSDSRISRSQLHSPIPDPDPLTQSLPPYILPSFPDVPGRADDGPLVAPAPRFSRSSDGSMLPLLPEDVQLAASPSGRSPLISSLRRASLDDVQPEPTADLTANVPESRFRFNERQRQNEFMQEEEQRQTCFSKAEFAREEAERARTTILERREANRDQAFQAMMSMHRDSFEGSEASRSWREEWRTQESDAAEEHRTESFRRALALIEKQFHAVNDLEADVVERMTSKLGRSNQIHRTLFERARQQRSAAFSLSQARREHDLLMPSWKLENDDGFITEDSDSTGPVWNRPPPTGRRSSILGRSRYPRARRSSSSSGVYSSDVTQPSMVLESGLGVPEPPTGFHPRALFHEVEVRQPLPVPGVYKHHASKDSSDQHPRRYLTFTKSQAERDELFEKGTQRRRRIFNANERQRELRFEQLQTKTTEASIQHEGKRSIKFVNAQNARQTAFRDAERQRESNFRDAETRRAERYKAAQVDRDASFYSTQEMLQRQCFQFDYLRTSNFDERAAHSLRAEEASQTGAYKVEEREREARFARVIKMCAEHRAAGGKSTLPE